MTPPDVLAGVGALGRLADTASERGWRRALVVAGQREDALADRIGEVLTRRSVGRWADVRGRVPAAAANGVVAAAQETHADAVVALGGSPAVGLAKIVGVALGIPVAAVATGFDGGEMTAWYGVTTAAGWQPRRSERARPAVVVHDPETIDLVPTDDAVSSALHGLVHCLDAQGDDQARPIALAAGRFWGHVLPIMSARGTAVVVPLAFAAARLSGAALELAGRGPRRIVADALVAMGWSLPAADQLVLTTSDIWGLLPTTAHDPGAAELADACR